MQALDPTNLPDEEWFTPNEGNMSKLLKQWASEHEQRSVWTDRSEKYPTPTRNSTLSTMADLTIVKSVMYPALPVEGPLGIEREHKRTPAAQDRMRT